MATTSIKTKKEDGEEVILMFMTAPKKDGGIDVDVFLANAENEPVGTPSIGYDLRTEEDYHKDLRRMALEKNEFIPDHSTNHEWNPGYVEPEEPEQDAAI